MPSLPPFPVDDQTLDLLWSAIHPDPAVSDRTSVGDLLQLMSQLGGSDITAVESVIDEGDASIPGIGGAPIHVMRDPQYHEHDVVAALIVEVRRLRGAGN